MNILDPKLGGKLRAAIAVLSAVAVVVTAILASHDVPWLASILTVINGLLGVLTHFTAAGNATEAG